MAESVEPEGSIALVNESFGLTERSEETLQLIETLRACALHVDNLIGEATRFLSIESACPKITSVQDKQVAADRLRTGKRLDSAIDTSRLDMTRPIDKIKQKFIDYVVPTRRLLQGACDSYNKEINAFDREEEQKRLAELRRRERIADQERARLEADARAKEAAAKEAARKDREKAEQLRNEGKAGQAARLESRAESKVNDAAVAAESLRAVATTVEAQAVEDTTKVEGLSTRWNYDAVCDDVLELAKAIVASNGMFPPSTVLTIDKKVMKAQATALKDRFAYPGCRLVKTPINVSR